MPRKSHSDYKILWWYIVLSINATYVAAYKDVNNDDEMEVVNSEF